MLKEFKTLATLQVIIKKAFSCTASFYVLKKKISSSVYFRRNTALLCEEASRASPAAVAGGMQTPRCTENTHGVCFAE